MDFTKQLKAGAAHLREHDHILAPIIQSAGLPSFRPHTDYFNALAGSIIGQQLSVKAAATIRDRFAALGQSGFPTPEEVMGFPDGDLRTIGLSGAKVKYVKDLAAHVFDGRLRVRELPDLTNDEIIVEVTDVKGVGEWTAHMFLMFCLGRLDVLPTGDLGIRKGVQALYGLRDLPDPVAIQAIAEKYNWLGYESIATWYVWRSIDLDVAI